MQGFTTTENGGWTFDLGDKPEVPELPEESGKISYLDDPEVWKVYSDDALYEVETLFLEWAERMMQEPKFRQNNPVYRRYTCGMVFEQLYGRKYDVHNSDDHVSMRRLPKIMSYYSSKIQKEGSIRGKKVTRTIYTLSIRRIKTLPPFSLKLREEWLAKRGEVPTWSNMKPSKDRLKPGHARNPRTDENMARRRERAREIYNERYAGRAH